MMVSKMGDTGMRSSTSRMVVSKMGDTGMRSELSYLRRINLFPHCAQSVTNSSITDFVPPPSLFPPPKFGDFWCRAAPGRPSGPLTPRIFFNVLRATYRTENAGHYCWFCSDSTISGVADSV